jgi:hypothetical protein
MGKLTVPDLPKAKRGRKYLCIAPFAWGAGSTGLEAVQNARRNFSPSMGGKWRYILYDAPSSAVVTGMGDIEYTIPKNQRQPWSKMVGQIREIHRQNMPKEVSEKRDAGDRGDTNR